MLYEKLINNELISKAIHNFGWLLADKLIKLAAGFIVSIFVARYLGPDIYGQVAYGVAYIALFQAISNLGIDSLAVRDMACSPQKELILVSIVKLRLLSSTICTLCALSVSTLLFDNDFVSVYIMSFAILFTIGDVIDLWFQSQSKSKITVVAKLSSYSIIVLLKILAIYFLLEKYVFYIFVPLEFMLTSIFMIYALSEYGGVKFKINVFDREYVLKLLKESWPLALSGLSIVIFMRSGSFFVERMLGYDSVGIYSVGTSLAEIIYFVPMLLVTSFSPVLSKTKLIDEFEYNVLFMKLLFFMFWGCVLVVSLYGFFGYFIIPYLYGHEYENAKYVFAIQVFTLIPVAIGCCQSLWIVNEGRTKIALYQTVVGACTSVILNFILVERFGIIGASISTLIAQLMQSFFINYFVCKELFFYVLRSLFYKIKR
ncbi:flippase [Aeromonas veronii]